MRGNVGVERAIFDILPYSGVVIPNGAPQAVKDQATRAANLYGTRIAICDGTADNTDIDAVITAVGANGTTFIYPGTYTCSGEVTIDLDEITVIADSCIFNYSGTGFFWQFTQAGANFRQHCKLHLGKVVAVGDAITGANAGALQITGMSHSDIKVWGSGFNAGTAFNPNTSSVNTKMNEMNIYEIYAQDTKWGIKCTGDSSNSYCSLKKLEYINSLTTLAGGKGIDSSAATAISYGWIVDQMQLSPGTDNAWVGVDPTYLQNCVVQSYAMDSSTFGTASQLINDLTKGWTFKHHFLTVGDATMEDNLVEETSRRDWTSHLDPSGYTYSSSGAGSHAYRAGTACDIGSGTANSGYGLAAYYLTGILDASTSWDRVNWSKDIVIDGYLGRGVSEANTVAYVQLKEVNTAGILAQRGIGIAIANLALTLESHDGTTRSTQSAGYSLSNYLSDRFRLVFSSGRYLKLYINDVLKATITTNLATGAGAATAYFVNSITNGAAGVTDCQMLVGNVKLTNYKFAEH